MAGVTTIGGITPNEYLASTVGAAFGGATLASSTVDVNSYGEKILQPGTVLAKITSGADAGKVGPYDSGATDGRQEVANIVGISDSLVNVTHTDEEVTYLYAGIVYESKVYCDGTQGSIDAAVKTQLRSGEGLNILFK